MKKWSFHNERTSPSSVQSVMAYTLAGRYNAQCQGSSVRQSRIAARRAASSPSVVLYSRKCGESSLDLPGRDKDNNSSVGILDSFWRWEEMATDEWIKRSMRIEMDTTDRVKNLQLYLIIDLLLAIKCLWNHGRTSTSSPYPIEASRTGGPTLRTD